jgi:asparagine synthase (glutamine-hydrolysing)
MSGLAGVLRAGSLTTPLKQRSCLLDGTVFNLAALASELGVAAVPATVLLAAHERWGERMVGRLRGNFAFAILDPGERRALLACDQLGSRSLLFHRDGPSLTFATEIRDLLRLLPRRPPPDEAAVVGWIAGAPGLGGGTMYRGIARLGPGELLSVSERGSEVRRYWEPVFRQPPALSQEEAAGRARESLDAAVRRQLPEAGATGVLLSGGLDSASVAALAAGAEPRRTPRAYSATFPGHPSIDESGLVADARAALGLRGSSIAVRGGSMVQGSLEYLRDWELPAASPNHFLWQPLLRRAAADGVTAMLDGEGGDELWGFSPYLLADRLRSGRALSALRLTRTMAAGEPWRVARRRLRTFGLVGAAPAGAHGLVRRLRGPEHYAPAHLSAAAAQLLFEQSDPWAWKRRDGPRWWSYMADLLIDTRARLGVADYLRHRAVSAGLEDRHPLIDLDLVELALGLPPALAIEAELDRPLLREAMAGAIPDSIRLRPAKSYFTALLGDCLGGRDLPLVRRLLDGSPEVGRYLRPEAIPRLLEGPSGQRMRLARSWSLWRLLTAECWLRSQADGDFAAGLLDECDTRAGDWELAPTN